jgi:hypothetical protein
MLAVIPQAWTLANFLGKTAGRQILTACPNHALDIHGRSWRLIARDLHEDTGGQIDVTAETLRSWFASLERVA